MKHYDANDYNFLYKDTTRANRYYSLHLRDEAKAVAAKGYSERKKDFNDGRMDALDFKKVNYETKSREYARGYMTVIRIYNQFIEEESYFDNDDDTKFYTFNSIFHDRFLLDKCSQEERHQLEYRLGYRCGILSYKLNSLEKVDTTLDDLAKNSDYFMVGYRKGLFALGYLNGLLRGNINSVFNQDNHPSGWLKNNENFCDGIECANRNTIIKVVGRSK